MPITTENLQKSQHGTWIEIRKDRLLHNLQALRQNSIPNAEVLAVVKANAYGHGVLEIAKTLEGVVSYLGVSSIAEALELKERGIETPIFLFGRVFDAELPAVVTDGITLSVSSLEEAEEISRISESLKRKTTLHIKVDTGMGRLGIPCREALGKIESMAQLPGLTLEGIYTHFPTSESRDGFMENQVENFSALVGQLESKGIRFRYRHASNSAGSVKLKTPVLNLIRPGLMLYGIYPDESVRNFANVSPILSLKSRIILAKRLKAGESAGYGRSFVAEKSTHIGVLPIGYSHGYPFAASEKAWILYRGKHYPIAGRVSMDYTTIHFGDTEPRAGEEVTLIGEDSGEKIRAEDLAGWAGTIPYEIVTRLIPRLPRFYRS